MSIEEFYKNDDLLKDIVSLRRKGYSNVSIYYELYDKYGAPRHLITSYLREIGLLISKTHGGYRPGSGKGNKYVFEGEILDSLGEFVTLLYYRQSGINLNKVKEPILLESGINYVPDFLDNKGNYYEVKNLSNFDDWGWNVNKRYGFPFNLIIITSEQLEEMKIEVDKIYGSKFYDNYLR